MASGSDPEQAVVVVGGWSTTAVIGVGLFCLILGGRLSAFIRTIMLFARGGGGGWSTTAVIGVGLFSLILGGSLVAFHRRMYGAVTAAPPT